MGFSNSGGVRLGVAQRRQTQPRNRGPMASERCLKVRSIANRKAQINPVFQGTQDTLRGASAQSTRLALRPNHGS